MDLKSLSLSQLVFRVKEQLNLTFDSPVWITAEIGELNVNYSGHCYLELIEKEEETEKLIAKTRATIWANTFRIIKSYFETTTRESLKAGLKVLIKVTVEFHEFYGFSLNVQDIDPSFTVGDLVLKRNLIIEKLTSEGVIDMNKALEIPMVPQRIAVISSETAAGFGDFVDQLNSNDQQIHFSVKLFPAVMQGNNAAESIVNAFNQLFDEIDDFEVVVLIRGGGSKIDLSCFDDFDIAYVITQFPLPVITGIGHDRDESVSDIVANTALKTPTAVAEFLIDTAEEYWYGILEANNQIQFLAKQFVDSHQMNLNNISSELYHLVKGTFDSQYASLEHKDKYLKTTTQQLIHNRTTQLSALGNAVSILSKSQVKQAEAFCELRQKRLFKWLNNYMNTKQTKLDSLSSKIDLVNPQNVLNRGFAIVSQNGSAVKDSSQLEVGDRVDITLSKGTLSGEVKEVKD